MNSAHFKWTLAVCWLNLEFINNHVTIKYVDLMSCLQKFLHIICLTHQQLPLFCCLFKASITRILGRAHTHIALSKLRKILNHRNPAYRHKKLFTVTHFPFLPDPWALEAGWLCLLTPQAHWDIFGFSLTFPK